MRHVFLAFFILCVHDVSAQGGKALFLELEGGLGVFTTNRSYKPCHQGSGTKGVQSLRLKAGYMLDRRLGLLTGVSYWSSGYEDCVPGYPHSGHYLPRYRFHYLGLPVAIRFKAGSEKRAFITEMGVTVDRILSASGPTYYAVKPHVYESIDGSAIDQMRPTTIRPYLSIHAFMGSARRAVLVGIRFQKSTENIFQDHAAVEKFEGTRLGVLELNVGYQIKYMTGKKKATENSSSE